MMIFFRVFLYSVFRVFLYSVAPPATKGLFLLLSLFPEAVGFLNASTTFITRSKTLAIAMAFALFICALVCVPSSAYFVIAVIQNLLGVSQSALLVPLASLKSASMSTYLFHFYMTTAVTGLQLEQLIDAVTVVGVLSDKTGFFARKGEPDCADSNGANDNLPVNHNLQQATI